MFSKFERKVEDGVEGAASILEKSDLTPVQITKKAEKQMKREKMVGNGRQIAPTLYTCLVSEADDAKLFGYYPTLAGEVETFLQAKAQDLGYSLDCKPLVRFVPDPDLKRGKFDVIAELVAPQTVAQLRREENERYGIASEPQVPARQKPAQNYAPQAQQPAAQSYAPQAQQPAAQSYAPQAQQPAAQSYAPQVPQAANVAPSVPSVQSVPSAAAAASAVASQVAQATPHPAASEIPALQNDNLAGLDVYNNTPSADFEPAQASKANLEVYLYDEDNDIAYKLTGAPERIGRESSNDIVISDINASRVHAEIHMEPNGTWIVSDLGSTNGLYVNGRRVKSAPLNDEDIVLIGTTRLEFQNLQ